MRNSSSLIASGENSSSTTGVRVQALSKSLPNSGANVRAVRSRRSTSSARFLAVAINHAEGFSGTPRTGHVSTARQKASCTTSSASARLCAPKIRVSTDTMRPASRRNRWLSSSIEVLSLDRPHFDRPTALENRTLFREFDGLRQVPGLHDDIATYDIFGLGEGAVVHDLLLPRHDLACFLKRVPWFFEMALRVELLEPCEPRLEVLLHFAW